jgi:hypothetical protein
MQIHIKNLHLSVLFSQDQEAQNEQLNKLAAACKREVFETINGAAAVILKELADMAKTQKELNDTLKQVGNAANDMIGRFNVVIEQMKAKNAQTNEIDLTPEIDLAQGLINTFHGTLAASPDIPTVPVDSTPPTAPVLPEQPQTLDAVPVDVVPTTGSLPGEAVANSPSQ